MKGERQIMVMIRPLMLSKGVTSTELAERLKVTKQRVSRMLQKDIRVSTLERILDVLDCDLAIVPREGGTK